MKSRGDNRKIKIISLNTSRRDRPFEITELLNYCRHFSRVSSEFSSNKLGIVKKYILDYFFQFKETREFTFEKNSPSMISRFSRIYGYFQNWEYVENTFHIIGSEIESYLKTIDISAVKIPNKYIGIHVRRGDNLFTLKTMGSLSSNYYKSALMKISEENKLPVVVFTDDLKGASDVLETISPNYIFGPNDLSVWQSLKLMANSDYLITANSTFSWWAAILGFKSKRIKRVIIPDPWFRDWETPILDAFQYPGFEVKKSEFIQEDKFVTDYKII
jgi:hypothetical protein